MSIDLEFFITTIIIILIFILILLLIIILLLRQPAALNEFVTTLPLICANGKCRDLKSAQEISML